jgi:hypothetical protein
MMAKTKPIPTQLIELIATTDRKYAAALKPLAPQLVTFIRFLRVNNLLAEASELAGETCGGGSGSDV